MDAYKSKPGQQQSWALGSRWVPTNQLGDARNMKQSPVQISSRVWEAQIHHHSPGALGATGAAASSVAGAAASSALPGRCSASWFSALGAPGAGAAAILLRRAALAPTGAAGWSSPPGRCAVASRSSAPDAWCAGAAAALLRRPTLSSRSATRCEKVANATWHICIMRLWYRRRVASSLAGGSSIWM